MTVEEEVFIWITVYEESLSPQAILELKEIVREHSLPGKCVCGNKLRSRKEKELKQCVSCQKVEIYECEYPTCKNVAITGLKHCENH